MKKSSGSFAVFAALIIVFVSLFSFACTPSGLVVFAALQTPTAVQTAPIEPRATPDVILSPSPAPTETPLFSTERTAELNQQFQDFLNKEGEFSEEAISNRLLSCRDQTLDLGWFEGDEAGVTLQAWFFDYIISDDYIVMAVGFNGIDGKNHIKPMAIPIRYFEANNPSVQFGFTEMGDWSTTTSYQLVWESSEDNIVSRLNIVKGNPVNLTLYTNMSDEIVRNGVAVFGKGCEPYLNEFKKTNDLVNCLMSEISVSTNEEILSQEAVYNPSAVGSVPDMNSVDDFMSIDVSTAPRVFMIWSNLW